MHADGEEAAAAQQRSEVAAICDADAPSCEHARARPGRAREMMGGQDDIYAATRLLVALLLVPVPAAPGRVLDNVAMPPAFTLPEVQDGDQFRTRSEEDDPLLRDPLLRGLQIPELHHVPRADWVNVRDFGAKGDNVTDDTAGKHAPAKTVQLSTECVIPAILQPLRSPAVRHPRDALQRERLRALREQDGVLSAGYM
jgi:hypothetical protein